MSEITRGVPEDREDVLELSSGLVQHSDDSQRNEEGRAKEAQRGGEPGGSQQRVASWKPHEGGKSGHLCQVMLSQVRFDQRPDLWFLHHVGDWPP